MRIRSCVALVVALTLGARAAAADVSTTATTSVAAQMLPAPDGNGVILPNDTFLLYLRDQAEFEGCKMRLEVRDRLLKETASGAERTWIERNGFWLGMTLGFVGAIGLTWGTVKTLSSAR